MENDPAKTYSFLIEFQQIYSLLLIFQQSFLITHRKKKMKYQVLSDKAALRLVPNSSC